MTITIESINGKQYTVVWHVTPPTCGTLGKRFSLLNGGWLVVFAEAECMSHIATALPALPRHPKPEHARLLHLYAAHGLYPTFGIYQFAHMDDDGEVYGYGNAGLEMIANTEITHATDSDGNKIKVAIEG